MMPSCYQFDIGAESTRINLDFCINASFQTRIMRNIDIHVKQRLCSFRTYFKFGKGCKHISTKTLSFSVCDNLMSIEGSPLFFQVRIEMEKNFSNISHYFSFISDIFRLFPPFSKYFLPFSRNFSLFLRNFSETAKK